MVTKLWNINIQVVSNWLQQEANHILTNKSFKYSKILKILCVPFLFPIEIIIEFAFKILINNENLQKYMICDILNI